LQRNCDVFERGGEKNIQVSLFGDFIQTESALLSCLPAFDVVDGVRLLSQLLPSVMPQARAQTREVPPTL